MDILERDVIHEKIPVQKRVNSFDINVHSTNVFQELEGHGIVQHLYCAKVVLLDIDLYYAGLIL